MTFSQTTEVHGKIHANGGIEFNGVTDAPIQSAQETYYDYGWHDGVWGSGGPTDFWKFPVPEVDFNGVTADLSAIQDLADTIGVHLLSSGEEGYLLDFQEDATIDVYRVDSVLCYYGEPNGWGWWNSDIYCYDLGNTTYLTTYLTEEAPVMFIEDNVWVQGVLDGRVTVAVAEFPEVSDNYKHIFIPDNLTYKEIGEDDTLGLIAQGDIIVPKNVPDDMTIHAAALSQYGKINKPFYQTFYSDTVRNSLVFFGAQISYEGGGWKWQNGSTVISGFVYTNHMYDGNLLYYPPAGFPVGDTYELISWEQE